MTVSNDLVDEIMKWGKEKGTNKARRNIRNVLESSETRPFKVLELFAGIGACSKALTNLGIEHEIVDAVEIDKYAIKSFNAVHGTNFEPQDITKWDKDIECDLIMHGSPCQDFSVAGLQAGGDEGSGTRSSLMYETLRIVKKLKPKYVIWENVKNLLSKKHRHNFDAYQKAMEQLGYINTYKVLNAKDYGVPQNRERVFTVSIRVDLFKQTNGSLVYDAMTFVFPSPIPLEKKLKDVLETEVDEKYYISDRMMDYFMGVNQKPSKFPRKERFLANINRKDQDRANSITTAPGQRPTDNFVIDDYNQRVRADQDTIGTLTTNCGATAPRNGWKIAEPKIIDDIYKNRPAREYDKYSPTLRTYHAGDLKVYNHPFRIRRLTPKECWRLMGFDDSDFEKADKVNSNTQLYKQAGNSIVVNVLEGVLRNLLGIDPTEALEAAHNKNKNRTGHTVNGNFIKDEDGEDN